MLICNGLQTIELIKVKINIIYSDAKLILTGILQGFIRGPRLVIIFVKDIFNFCLKIFKIYLYADSTRSLCGD